MLCHCLNKPRAYLYTWPEHIPDAQQVGTFISLVNRRSNGEPIAYLTGKREFWSLEFEVTENTLIPRPDTEILVAQSLAKLQDKTGPALDLGTGSGVVAICIALERKDIIVHATDTCKEALAVARRNADKHGAKVHFINSDWLENLTPQQYSIIVSNPPYIADNDPHLQQNGLPFEPSTALRSCDNGFADITAIIHTSQAYLQINGWLLLEHGHTQAIRTRDIMLNQGFNNIQTVQDLSGNDRVTMGQRL